jgi:hypothetical protein
VNPHVPTPAKNLAEAPRNRQGQSVGAKTQRERDYIDALAVIYVDHDKLGHLPRTQAYAKAMEKVALSYPNDDEAQIHYALALNTSASPATRPTQTAERRGDPGADLRAPAASSRRRPLPHPSLRLSADRREGTQCGEGLCENRARRAHAQHMPSHIFTRVGYWKESIDSNKVAQRVAKEASDFHDQLHAMDYQVYAYLQLGQDADAKAVLDQMSTVAGFTETFLVGPVCDGGFAGALRARARRLEDCGRTECSAKSVAASAGG